MSANTKNFYENLVLATIDDMVVWNPDGTLLAQVEELQNVSLANDQQDTEITGKNGRVIATLKRSKTVTITGSSGLISGGLISAQTGGTHEIVEDYVVDCYDDVILTDPTTAVISHDAVGVTGKEIRAVAQVLPGGVVDSRNALYQDAAASATKFTYDPVTRTLGFAEGAFEEGDTLRIFYRRKTTVTHVDNPTDKFAKNGSVVLTGTAYDMCDNVFVIQINIPRASFKGTFTVDIGESQSVHNFELTALAPKAGCANNTTGGSSYWDYIVFTDDEEEEEAPVVPVNPDEPGEEEEPGNFKEATGPVISGLVIPTDARTTALSPGETATITVTYVDADNATQTLEYTTNPDATNSKTLLNRINQINNAEVQGWTLSAVDGEISVTGAVGATDYQTEGATMKLTTSDNTVAEIVADAVTLVNGTDGE